MLYYFTIFYHSWLHGTHYTLLHKLQYEHGESYYDLTVISYSEVVFSKKKKRSSKKVTGLNENDLKQIFFFCLPEDAFDFVISSYDLFTLSIFHTCPNFKCL